jgi:hypothetical protein
MDFSQCLITLDLGERSQRVVIAPDALQFWWGADVGPQTAEGLIAAHLGEIEAIVADKLKQGAVDASGVVIVSDEDVE